MKVGLVLLVAQFVIQRESFSLLPVFLRGFVLFNIELAELGQVEFIIPGVCSEKLAPVEDLEGSLLVSHVQSMVTHSITAINNGLTSLYPLTALAVLIKIHDAQYTLVHL